MSKDAIREGIKRAVEHGFIIVAEDPRPRPGRPAHQYQLKVLEVGTLKSNKDQKSVLEVLGVGPSSEKDTIERNSKREKDTLLSSNEKPDPLSFDLERQTLENNESNYADPAHAGGADRLADVALLTLYGERGKRPPKMGSKQWEQQRSKVAQALAAYGYEKASLDLVEEAAALLCERKGDWTNVFHSSFPMDFGQALSDAEGTTTKRTAPRHQPESAVLSQEALQERQATRPPSPEDDIIGAIIKGELKLQMGQNEFQRYVQPARFTCDDGNLVIAAPDDFTRSWLENRVAVTIERALAGVDDGPGEVRFEVTG